MTIQILVDGREALTTAQAAEARGVTVGGMRKVFQQAGVRPVAHLDGRTPLYAAEDLCRLSRRGEWHHRTAR